MAGQNLSKELFQCTIPRSKQLNFDQNVRICRLIRVHAVRISYLGPTVLSCALYTVGNGVLIMVVRTETSKKYPDVKGYI